ncbi:hypothetical protein HDU79_008986 [Rhizoclosmatium sp. JEL0117]|nr:hypothetical protein HDU79_008986 [Rhizoclosmatium sp. JEL0117]
MFSFLSPRHRSESFVFKSLRGPAPHPDKQPMPPKSPARQIQREKPKIETPPPRFQATEYIDENSVSTDSNSKSTSNTQSNSSKNSRASKNADAATAALAHFINQNPNLNKDFLAHYHLVSQLGVGGFGFVCGAVRRTDGRSVAVKFIVKHRVHTWHADGLHKIPLEIYILKQVKHPNIISYVDYFEDDKFFYLVTEIFGTPWELEPTDTASRDLFAPFDSVENVVIQPEPTNKSKSTVGSDSLLQTDIPQKQSFSSNKGSVSPISVIRSTLASINFPSNDEEEFEEERRSLNVFRNKEPDDSKEQRATSDPATANQPLKRQWVHSSKPQKKVSLNLYKDPLQFTDVSRSITCPNISTLRRLPSMDLFECIERNDRLDNTTSRYIFKQIMSAVAYLHSHGVAHRDLKDENIVIDAEYAVKLIDFGSATLLHEWNDEVDLDLRDVAEKENMQGNYHSRFQGTLQFAPPEVLSGYRYHARPADIWACGILLYTILCGETPFSSVIQVVSEPPKTPRYECDPKVMELMNWMLAKDPQKRPTAKQVLENLWVTGAFEI